MDGKLTRCSKEDVRIKRRDNDCCINHEMCFLLPVSQDPIKYKQGQETINSIKHTWNPLKKLALDGKDRARRFRLWRAMRHWNSVTLACDYNEDIQNSISVSNTVEPRSNGPAFNGITHITDIFPFSPKLIFFYFLNWLLLQSFALNK